jgi:hypothetical protein
MKKKPISKGERLNWPTIKDTKSVKLSEIEITGKIGETPLDPSSAKFLVP